MNREEIIKQMTEEDFKRGNYVIVKDIFDNYTIGYLSDINLLSEDVCINPVGGFGIKTISFGNIERITKATANEPTFETSSEIKVFVSPCNEITTQIKNSLAKIRQSFVGRDIRIHSKLGEEYTALLENVELHGIEVLHEENKYTIKPIFKLIFKNHSTYSSTISKIEVGGIENE